VEEGQRFRGWIANSYSQIEFLLGDLIIRSRQFPQYQLQTQRLPNKVTSRIRAVSAMLEVEGPLSPFSNRLRDLIRKFELTHDVRNLLSHGFSIYNRNTAGESWFEFRKHHVEGTVEELLVIRNFRLSELEDEHRKFTELAQETMIEFRRIHDHFGWSA
jgi:hypothetical protein